MLGRQHWQKGSRLRVDGEQWAGRLSGKLGGAFQGTLGAHGRGLQQHSVFTECLLTST